MRCQASAACACAAVRACGCAAARPLRLTLRRLLACGATSMLRRVPDTKSRKPMGAASPRKGKAFETSSLAGSNSKCHVCGKTVYAMEFVGAAGFAFHKNCFKCTVCKTNLRADTYTTVNDTFYCKTHYEQAFKKGGNYDFDDKTGAEATPTTPDKPAQAAEPAPSSVEVHARKMTAPAHKQLNPSPLGAKALRYAHLPARRAQALCILSAPLPTHRKAPLVPKCGSVLFVQHVEPSSLCTLYARQPHCAVGATCITKTSTHPIAKKLCAPLVIYSIAKTARIRRR